MKRSPSKLRQWQRDHGLTDAEAGAEFGVTRMTWLRWKGGDMIPAPALMVELYVRGAAEPNDFYDLPDSNVSRVAA